MFPKLAEICFLKSKGIRKALLVLKYFLRHKNILFPGVYDWPTPSDLCYIRRISLFFLLQCSSFFLLKNKLFTKLLLNNENYKYVHWKTNIFFLKYFVMKCNKP